MKYRPRREASACLLFVLCGLIALCFAGHAAKPSHSRESEIAVFQNGGTLLVSSIDGRLHAVDAATGATMWSLSSGNPLLSSSDSESDEGQLIIPGVDGSVFVQHQGTVKPFPVTAREIVEAAPFRIDGTLFVGKKETYVYMVNPVTGQLSGVFRPGDKHLGQWAESGANGECDDDLVSPLLLSRSEYIVAAFDGHSKKPRWNVSFAEYSADFSPRFHDTHNQRALGLPMVACSLDGLLSLVDPLNPTSPPKWTVSLGSPVASVHYRSSTGDVYRIPHAYVQSGFQGLGPSGGATNAKNAFSTDANIGVFIGHTLSGQPFALSNLALSSQGRASKAILSSAGKVPIAAQDTPLLLAPTDRTSQKSGFVFLPASYFPQLAPPIIRTTPDGEELHPGSNSRLSGLVLGLAGFMAIGGVVSMVVAVRVARGRSKSRTSIDAAVLVKPSEAPFVPPLSTPVRSTKHGSESARKNRKHKGNKAKPISFADAATDSKNSSPSPPAAAPQSQPQSEPATAPAPGSAPQSQPQSVPQSQPEATPVVVPGAVRKAVMAEPGVQVVGKLKIFITEVLGMGSHGTMVYRGTFEDRPVAVKRILSAFFYAAAKEISLLIDSDHNPYVLRYYAKEEDGDFVYLALELCKCSVAEVVTEWKDAGLYKNGRIPHNIDLRGMMTDMLSGVAHLHKLGIVHRDIKPQNILITKDNRCKIADMGLGKKLELTKFSFCIGVESAVGSTGWLAPELYNQGRLTAAIDIFSLGCVFFSVLTGGLHPFGEDRLSRDLRIREGRPSLDPIKHMPEAVGLIRWMINSDYRLRPTAQEALGHPFFWTPQKQLDFLLDCSDRMEREDQDSPLKATLESKAREALGLPSEKEEKEREMREEKERELKERAHRGVGMRGGRQHHQSVIKEPKPGDGWSAKLDQELLDELGKHRKYVFTSIRDLLRVIRNKKHHYLDLTEDVRRKLGPLPAGFLHYFTSRFPLLLMYMYEFMAATVFEEYHEKYFQHMTEQTRKTLQSKVLLKWRNWWPAVQPGSST